MKQRLLIFVALIFLIAMLIGLNAASYVQKEQLPDAEFYPNRSTYNTGATGTRAFYDLLSETGRRVMRWKEKPSALKASGKDQPNTLVIIGLTRRNITDDDARKILEWVATGKKLVIIDREPPESLITSSGPWKLQSVPPSAYDAVNLDPSNQQQMTDKTPAAKPVQPTIFTAGINAVQPSRLASGISIQNIVGTVTGIGNPKVKATPTYEGPTDDYDEEYEPPPPTKAPKPTTKLTGLNITLQSNSGNSNKPGVKTIQGDSDQPGPVAKVTPGNGGIGSATPPSNGPLYTLPTPTQQPIKPINVKPQAQLTAPIVHLASSDKNILADFPYGAGQIVWLSDPYIVSNAGIRIVDNAQLGINILALRNGLVAFDEYHQGYGENESRLMSYFSGTPVTAILLQIALLFGFIFWSQSRRFARPVPLVEPNRLSKLEYVTAMAELQQKTRAYDLAIENIYKDFRRRAGILLGVDGLGNSRKDLAQRIAERIGSDPFEVYKVMQKCEDIMHGEDSNPREVVKLAGQLREFEQKLGIKRTKKGALSR